MAWKGRKIECQGRDEENRKEFNWMSETEEKNRMKQKRRTEDNGMGKDEWERKE